MSHPCGVLRLLRFSLRRTPGRFQRLPARHLEDDDRTRFVDLFSRKPCAFKGSGPTRSVAPVWRTLHPRRAEKARSGAVRTTDIYPAFPDSGRPVPGEPPGVLLRALLHPGAHVRRRATFGILERVRGIGPPAPPTHEALRRVLAAEWTALGPRGEGFLRALDDGLRAEPSLLVMEVVACALAAGGPGGVVRLLRLLASGDVVLRHKAAVGLGTLDASSRWAAPHLARFLDVERVPLVARSLEEALGRIGGGKGEGAEGDQKS